MRKNKREMHKRYGEVTVFEPIKVTNHAVQRHRERGLLDGSDDVIREDIIKKVRVSRLFKLKGREEHREWNGYMFVCKREKDKNGIDVVSVITELLATPRKLENFGKRYV